MTLTLFEDALSSLFFLFRLSDVNNYQKRRQLLRPRKLVLAVTLLFGSTREIDSKIAPI